MYADDVILVANDIMDDSFKELKFMSNIFIKQAYGFKFLFDSSRIKYIFDLNQNYFI